MLTGWLSYEAGAFGFTLRTSLAIAVWWIVALGFALGLLPRTRPAAGALIVGGVFAALTLWTAISIAWSAGAENAYTEFERTALYLGVYTLVVFAADVRRAGAIAGGIGAGLVFVAVVALISRFFPSTFSTPQINAYLPGAVSRLSFPIDYWNGLGNLLALGLPLLLRGATRSGASARGALSVAPFPALVAAIYLSGSRGGFIAASIGTVCFVALSARRWTALAAALVAGAGSVGAIAILMRRDELVNGPLGTARVASQGHSAAVWIALICVATGLVFATIMRVARRDVARSRELGWSLLAVVLVLFAVGVVAAHPVRRFHDFEQPRLNLARQDSIRQHFLNGGGTGRWQLWQSAVDEFETRPIVGRGAGSFEAWWAQHGTLDIFTENAHSLYLETLGGLGVVGLALLLGTFVGGVAVGVRGLARLSIDRRIDVAAFTAVFAAYAFGCGVDWLWQLTINSLIGVSMLGLLCAARGTAIERRAMFRLRAPLRAAAVLVALGFVAVEGLGLLTQVEISRSQSEAADDNLVSAHDHAELARRLEPWAASPYVQLALVSELADDLSAGRQEIDSAVTRDPSDWRSWLIRARLETKSGEIAAARRSLDQARMLNPRSPIFTSS